MQPSITPEEDLHVSLMQAARLLGISRIVAWKHARLGRLGPTRVGRGKGGHRGERLEVSLKELTRRYAIDPARLNELR